MQTQTLKVDAICEEEIMRGVSRFALLAVAAISLLCSSAARADTMTFTITDPVQYASVGSTVSFSATVTAPSANTGTIYLLGDSFNIESPLTVDDNPFLNNFPFTLSPGESFSDVLFNVIVPGDTPVQDYFGSFTLQASTDGINENIDISDPFQVNVTPEPSALLLFGTVLVGLAIAVTRGKRLAT